MRRTISIINPFTEILAAYPVPFVIALILFEAATGLLILSQGKAATLMPCRHTRLRPAARLGLAPACLFITPVGIEEITAPLLAVPFLILLRREFPRPVLRLLGAPWTA